MDAALAHLPASATCRGCSTPLLATSAVAILRQLCPRCMAAGLAAVEAAKQCATDAAFARASALTAEIAQRPLWSTETPLVIRGNVNQPYQKYTLADQPRCFSVPTTTGLVAVEETADGIRCVDMDNDTLSAATLTAFKAWLAQYDLEGARLEAEDARLDGELTEEQRQGWAAIP